MLRGSGRNPDLPHRLPRARRVAIVADSHLEGPGGDPAGLLEQLKLLPQQGFDRLVLLGDILHLWIGLPSFATEGTRRLCEVLAGLRAKGVAVDYLEGNRDFFLDASVARESFDRLGLELGLQVGSKRCLFVHGDLVRTEDWGYRAWRLMSKSRPVRWLVSVLPHAFALPLVYGIERRLAHTNFVHRDCIPESSVQSYARNRMAEGFNLVVIGHFHQGRRWQFEQGEAWIVEAWFRSRKIEILEDTPEIQNRD